MSVAAPRRPEDRAGTHDDDGGGCPWAPRHLPCVVYTRRLRDRFRKRFWLRCWTCELRDGPFEAWPMANVERQWMEER
jgi:hypothetical protein